MERESGSMAKQSQVVSSQLFYILEYLPRSSSLTDISHSVLGFFGFFWLFFFFVQILTFWWYKNENKKYVTYTLNGFRFSNLDIDYSKGYQVWKEIKELTAQILCSEAHSTTHFNTCKDATAFPELSTAGLTDRIWLECSCTEPHSLQLNKVGMPPECIRGLQK